MATFPLPVVCPPSPPPSPVVVPGARVPVEVVDVEGAARALHRVADDALERYELFIGTGGDAPDPDGTPDATSASLPFDSSALPPDDEYRLLVRYRNRFGLTSQNLNPTRLFVDPAGDSGETPPSPPVFEVLPSVSGSFLVRAWYWPGPDGGNAADAFVVWVKAGSAPDPDVDTPDRVESFVVADGTARLEWTTSTYPDATVLHAVVRSRRSSPTQTDSTNTTALTATGDTGGPDAPDGGAYLGSRAEEVQT